MALIKSIINNQRGSTLIYILFLIAIVAIVAGVMLTTVTFAQRNIVTNQEALAHFYRAEGAFEVAIAQLENRSLDDRYAFLNGLSRNQEFVYGSYTIAGINVPIRATLTKTIYYEVPDGEVIVEEDEAEPNEELTRTEIFQLRLFDPLNQHSRSTNYRLLSYSYEFEGEGDGEDPGSPPGSCIFPQGCQDRRGHITIPPPPTHAPDGTPYPSGIAYTYEDGDYVRVFHTGDPNLPVADNILLNPVIHTSGILVLPEELGNLRYINQDVRYSADQGMYIGVSISNTSYRSIELTSDSGNIVLGEGVEIRPTNNIIFRSNTGNIVVDGATLVSVSNGVIQMETGGEFYGNGSHITSSNEVSIQTGGDLIAQSSFMRSQSNGPIILESNGTIDISGTSSNRTRLQSSGSIQLNAGRALFANYADVIPSASGGVTLSAGTNIQLGHADIPGSGPSSITAGGQIMANSVKISSTGWTDVQLTAGGDISIQAANLSASRDLLLTSSSTSHTIFVANARIGSRNNTAIARPVGINIVGTPATGSIVNN